LYCAFVFICFDVYYIQYFLCCDELNKIYCFVRFSLLYFNEKKKYVIKAFIYFGFSSIISGIYFGIK
jgi:hypothetical protein